MSIQPYLRVERGGVLQVAVTEINPVQTWPNGCDGFNSQEPRIEHESHLNLHKDFTVDFSTYHGRPIAKFTYGTAAQQFTGTDGNTIQAVAKNPNE